MKIKKHANGWYYAHASGSRPINLKTRNAETAKALAAEAKIEQIERAYLANAITQEFITRLRVGNKSTGLEALARWVEYADTVGLSATTKHRYSGSITLFLRTYEMENGPISGITEKQVDDFVNGTDEKLTRASRMNRLHALRSFLAVAARHGFVMGNAADLVKVNMGKLTFAQKEPKVRDIFTDPEIQKMSVRLPGEFWRPAVFFANEYGLRISDVANLEWAQFNLEKRTLVVWTDKHDKRIELKLTEATLGVLAMIPKTDPTYLFPREQGIASDPATRSMLSVYFGRELKRLGITGKSFHCLRHTFATRNRGLGESVDSIRERLGHSSSQTTEGYIHDGGNTP